MNCMMSYDIHRWVSAASAQRPRPSPSPTSSSVRATPPHTRNLTDAKLAMIAAFGCAAAHGPFRSWRPRRGAAIPRPVASALLSHSQQRLRRRPLGAAAHASHQGGSLAGSSQQGAGARRRSGAWPRGHQRACKRKTAHPVGVKRRSRRQCLSCVSACLPLCIHRIFHARRRGERALLDATWRSAQGARDVGRGPCQTGSSQSGHSKPRGTPSRPAVRRRLHEASRRRRSRRAHQNGARRSAARQPSRGRPGAPL